MITSYLDPIQSSLERYHPESQRYEKEVASVCPRFNSTIALHQVYIYFFFWKILRERTLEANRSAKKGKKKTASG